MEESLAASHHLSQCSCPWACWPHKQAGSFEQSGQPATPSPLCACEHPPAAPESLPCADVETSANPDLNRCDKGPLDELIDWEPKDHEAEELLADRHHWQDHGKQEDRGSQQHAPA